ncbi:hypothetical protein BURCENBC7_AP2460 [Burkholderia cenocepacia BC7]|nr:hypothetical protein BURCENBC7_AP2460 [Burkholderia cenocepacia BC7]
MGIEPLRSCAHSPHGPAEGGRARGRRKGDRGVVRGPMMPDARARRQ